MARVALADWKGQEVAAKLAAKLLPGGGTRKFLTSEQLEKDRAAFEEEATRAHRLQLGSNSIDQAHGIVHGQCKVKGILLKVLGETLWGRSCRTDFSSKVLIQAFLDTCRGVQVLHGCFLARKDMNYSGSDLCRAGLHNCAAALGSPSRIN